MLPRCCLCDVNLLLLIVKPVYGNGMYKKGSITFFLNHFVSYTDTISTGILEEEQLDSKIFVFYIVH